MFAKTIIDSDAFLDMPLSAQALYFHLSMRADDEGFINNPKKIQRVIGGSEDDLKLLVAKNFVIPFESGIVVIKHWKIHNYIRRDRLQNTVYEEEKAMLSEKKNGTYTLALNEITSIDSQMSDTCQSDVRQIADTRQHRLGKDRLGKDRLGKDKESPLSSKAKNKPQTKKQKEIYDTDEKLNQAILDFIEFRKKIRATMTDRAITLMLSKLNKMTNDNDEKIQILEQSIMNGWKSVYPLKSDKKQGKQSFDDFVEVGKEWLNDTAGVFDDSSND